MVAGLNILFSGVTSKLTLAKQLHSSLIPAFVDALTVPTVYPLPPNTTHYTGIYTAIRSSGEVALADIHLHKGSLALSGSVFRGIYLAYREPYRFQVCFCVGVITHTIHCRVFCGIRWIFCPAASLCVCACACVGKGGKTTCLCLEHV